MRKKGIKPAIPENPAPYLAEWLFEIGPGISTGQGLIEIGWDTLSDWQRNVGVELLPWEARLLKALSRDYVSQWYESRKPDCPAPYLDKRSLETNREAVARQAKAMFRNVAQDRPTQGLGTRKRKV